MIAFYFTLPGLSYQVPGTTVAVTTPINFTNHWKHPGYGWLR